MKKTTSIIDSKKELTHQEHTIDPVFDENSNILILGSFPSVLSRKNAFFYGHPNNRFWVILSTLFCEELPITIDEKKALLKKHHIALWDVIASCDIKGSDDSSIKNVIPNDLTIILNKAKINKIYVNGATAYKLYYKYLYKELNIEVELLPSTSPRNAAFNLDKLITVWTKIKDECI